MAKTKAEKKTGAKRATAKSGPKSGKAVPMDALQRYVRTRGLQFLDDPNITSVGIGHKPDGTLCVQFTVAEKVPEDEPERLEALTTQVLPESVDVDGVDVPTDVIERSYKPGYNLVKAEAKDARKTRQNPVMPGISVSHPSGTAGTLGAIVYDLQTGAPCMLSNWHVLHTGKGKLGDVIVQPGPHDDNRVSQNEAGTLLRSHLGAAGDCAIAQIEHRSPDLKIFELGTVITKLAKPELGDAVIKSGRTTGVTIGVVRRIDVTAKIPYEGVGPQKIGGFEIGPLEGAPSTYEVSMGGDSGSAWLIAEKDGNEFKATDIMVGLHFAGESGGSDDEHALACYASSVFQKLEIALDPPEVPSAIEAAKPKGYQKDFLGVRVGPPTLPENKKKDAVVLDGSTLIPYTHFSVCLSKSRRLAHFVAWNIDGDKLKAYGRKSLKFKLDPRIDEAHQIGEELYADNKLDRGHVARRADLVWGSKAEAQQANKDSFFFTNITPQHQAFNQSQRRGLWGELENAIFEDAEVEGLRVSVMGGPVFSKKDPVYRDIAIPKSFWKVLIYVDAEDKNLKAKAYVLTQNDLLNDIEAFELDPFRMYQIGIGELEDLVKLDFGPLAKADTFQPEAVGPEGVGRRRAIREVTSRFELMR